MITVHHSDISQLSHVSILSSPFITFVYLGSQNLVSCDIHIVILSSSDQWHLVETNCNNIFTTRNSWNISRSSKRHFFLTKFHVSHVSSKTMDGWGPLVYSLPSSAFSKLIRKSLITGDGDCTWPLMTCHHVTWHVIIIYPHPHHNHDSTWPILTPAVWTFEQAERFHVSRKTFM